MTFSPDIDRSMILERQHDLQRLAHPGAPRHHKRPALGHGDPLTTGVARQVPWSPKKDAASKRSLRQAVRGLSCWRPAWLVRETVRVCHMPA